MERALHRFPGLRIARQDPWECLISYICATYKNIPAIKSMISELSRRFGQKILFEGKSHFSFPTPDSLANATVNDLSSCGLGFRARAVREAAKHVRTGKVDFDSLKKASCKTAKFELLCLPGVGNKVADCTLLFSLEKLSAFPVDIWMKRVIKDHYSQNFDALFAKSLTEGNSLSTKAYERISEFAQGYFGKFAGYAQQYLFHYYRSLRNKACKS
jgi:N-glycosylase/DNA lyase